MIPSANFPALSARPWSKRAGTFLLSVALVALSAGSSKSFGQLITSTWIGSVVTGTGNWSIGLWDIPPQSGYNVVINNLIYPAVVNLDVDATVNQLTLGAGATLTIANSRRLELTASSAINGTLNLASAGGTTELRSLTASLTLSGTGSIVMSANASNHIRGGSSAGIVNQVTISGSGTVGDGQMAFTNQGAIIATNPSVPLVIDPNSSGFSNTGTLRATGGATLEIKDRTVLNSGGVIAADQNSHVDLFHSTVVGGTLTSAGTGHFHAIDATLSGVTITTGSTVELSNGSTLTLLGNLLNNGLISVIATSGTNELKFDGAATLSGSGSVVLSDATSNRVSAASGGSALTIGPAQTFSGAGEFGRNSLGLTNQGTILASGKNPLLVDSAGSSFVNQGTLKATGSGGMSLADSVTNSGIVEVVTGSSISVSGNYTQSGVASATKLAGGTFSATSFALQKGSIAGTGTIGGAVTATSDAAIIPGGSGTVGQLVFNSALILGPTTGLYFDLGGATPGTGHDRINGTSVTLDGALFLAFTNGFQSSVTSASTLTLISASTALNGTFASLPNGSRLLTTDGLGSFQINYLSNALTISNFQAIPEPSTYMLLGVGALGVIIAHRRRRRR
jgi:hypothetical protein